MTSEERGERELKKTSQLQNNKNELREKYRRHGREIADIVTTFRDARAVYDSRTEAQERKGEKDKSTTETIGQKGSDGNYGDANSSLGRARRFRSRTVRCKPDTSPLRSSVPQHLANLASKRKTASTIFKKSGTSLLESTRRLGNSSLRFAGGNAKG